MVFNKKTMFVAVLGLGLSPSVFGAMPSIVDSDSLIQSIYDMSLEAVNVLGIILLLVMFIVSAFCLIDLLKGVMEGKNGWSRVAISATVNGFVLVGLSFLMMSPDEGVEDSQVLPVATENVIAWGHFVAATFVGLIFIYVIFAICFVNEESSATADVDANNTIDKRMYELKNRSKRLAEICKKENIDGFSFTALSTVLGELITLLKNNKSYLGANYVRQFIHGHLGIYLGFIEEYESITGHFDDIQRSKVEAGVEDMIAGVESVVQRIINDKYLSIDVKGDVIRQINE